MKANKQYIFILSSLFSVSSAFAMDANKPATNNQDTANIAQNSKSSAYKPTNFNYSELELGWDRVTYDQEINYNRLSYKTQEGPFLRASYQGWQNVYVGIEYEYRSRNALGFGFDAIDGISSQRTAPFIGVAYPYQKADFFAELKRSLGEISAESFLHGSKSYNIDSNNVTLGAGLQIAPSLSLLFSAEKTIFDYSTMDDDLSFKYAAYLGGKDSGGLKIGYENSENAQLFSLSGILKF